MKKCKDCKHLLAWFGPQVRCELTKDCYHIAPDGCSSYEPKAIRKCESCEFFGKTEIRDKAYNLKCSQQNEKFEHYPWGCDKYKELKEKEKRKVYHGGCLNCITDQKECPNCLYYKFHAFSERKDLSTFKKDIQEAKDLISSNGVSIPYPHQKPLITEDQVSKSDWVPAPEDPGKCLERKYRLKMGVHWRSNFYTEGSVAPEREWIEVFDLGFFDVENRGKLLHEAYPDFFELYEEKKWGDSQMLRLIEFTRGELPESISMKWTVVEIFNKFKEIHGLH